MAKRLIEKSPTAKKVGGPKVIGKLIWEDRLLVNAEIAKDLGNERAKIACIRILVKTMADSARGAPFETQSNYEAAKIAQYYGLEKEMKEMYEILKTVRKPDMEFNISISDQLKKHPIFDECLSDPESVKKIDKMTIDEVHKMTEHLFNAETVHMEDCEYFINLAKPNELDTWIDQEVSRGERERKTYRDPANKINWNDLALPLGIFFILGILGTVILLSYLGS